MKIFAIILILAATLLLSGCAGLAVGSYGKHETLETYYRLDDGKNKLQSTYRTDPVHIYTEEEIIAHWGPPDSVQTVGCCKVLKYRGKVSWAGVGAFIIVIPIPLMIPTGHYESRFYIKEGKCVALVSEHGEVSSIFGWVAGGQGGRFYFGDSYNGPRKVPLDFCKENKAASPSLFNHRKQRARFRGSLRESIFFQIVFGFAVFVLSLEGGVGFWEPFLQVFFHRGIPRVGGEVVPFERVGGVVVEFLGGGSRVRSVISR